MPDSYTCLNNLGNFYFKKNDYQNAEHHYKRALETIKEGSHVAYNGLGLALCAQGKQAEAEQSFLEMLKRAPDRIDTLNNLGAMYREQKDYGRSIRYLDRSVQINPHHNVTAYYSLGFTYYEMKAYEKAKACFKKVVALKPDHLFAYYKLAYIYKQEGDLDQVNHWLAVGYPNLKDRKFLEHQ